MTRNSPGLLNTMVYHLGLRTDNIYTTFDLFEALANTVDTPNVGDKCVKIVDHIVYCYWVTQKLPQICTVILRICTGKVAWFAVYIFGNLWVTKYGSL